MQVEDGVTHPDVPEEARHVTSCVDSAVVTSGCAEPKTLGLGSG
jgi:hypothetical protein